MEGNNNLDSEWMEKTGSSPDFADFARQLAYDKTSYYGNGSYYTPFSVSTNITKNTLELAQNTLPDTAFKGYGTTKFATAKKDVTTLFLIDSEDRDKAAYPQPTLLTLKPPRVYKNVVGIQVAQLKMLCSFYYFREAKGNTFLPVIERGRETVNTFLSFPLTKCVKLDEGSYGIGDLMTQLQSQMNFTPLFYDYPSGISGFITAFTTNGDYGANFNQPGDYYKNPLTGDVITNPTMDQIVTQYWSSRNAGLNAYSIDQIKVAYYYPVLYEAFLDTIDTVVAPKLVRDVPASLLSSGDSVFSHLIYNSSGINDPIVLYLINANITLLDTYRLNHTFRYSLINRYELVKNAFTLRVNILSRSLNTSLVNLFTVKRSQALNQAIQNAGLTPLGFSNTSNSLNASQLVFKDMYNYIQTQLTTYFAIGFATYASEYFLNPENILFIQNGLQATNVRSGYTLEYLTSGQSPITSTTVTAKNSPAYWPNLVSGAGGGIDPSGMNVSSSMIAYSVTSSNFQFGTSVIDNSNYYINTNRSTRSVDSVITVKPATYTVFKFRSQTRQTLQVETLPLPYYYRFADYNKAGNYKSILDPNTCNVPQKYFDLSYNFLYLSTGGTRIDNSRMDSLNYSSLTLTPTYSFSTILSTSPLLPLNIQSNYTQFEFSVPYPSGITTGLYANTTNISFVSMVGNISTNFTTNVNAFVYHDRGAFMADLNSNFLRKENPLHFIVSTSATVADTNLTIRVSTFTGQKYYTIFRSQGPTLPNMQFKSVVYSDSNYIPIQTDYVNFDPLANPQSSSNLTNYPFVTNYNTDFLRLPTLSTLQGIDPSDPIYSLNTSVGSFPIGYDSLGVSDDLTDYRGYIPNQRGFVPNSQLRVDPFTTFTFQSLSPFDPDEYTYFNKTSQNQILEPLTNAPYQYDGTSTNQIKIVHWYDGYSLSRQIEDGFTTSNTISTAITSSIETYIQGFGRDTANNIQFGRGINAIGFLPTDGLYTISSFAFKSAIYPIQCISTTVEDPNTQIKYVGVYTGAYLELGNIQISSALAVLQFTQSHVYGPSTLFFTPEFGVELGTWYEYGFDSNFVERSNVKINGYTQAATELVNYTSMYYIVPFNSQGSNITFSRLTGSILPYPLSQVVSSGSTYFGQSNTVLTGTQPQVNYLMPSTVSGANPAYGPQGIYAPTQSQYELSQPITTTSLGYKNFGFLVQNSNALFPFTTTFSNSISSINRSNVGTTLFFTEYDDSLFLVNSLKNTFSNTPITLTGASYISSLSTTISIHGGTFSSVYYLLNPPSTTQNYSFIGLSNSYSTFQFQEMTSASNITTQSINLDLQARTATVWLWGGGGASNGGAGAYAKAEINIQALSNLYQTSTLYFVVGKGGNQTNNLYQPNYGAGGTADLTSQGGGFTGIFLDSNITTGLPLLVVGGGGAGGEITLGGPGGFGRDPIVQPILSSVFQSVVLNSSNYPKIPISFANILNVPSIYPSGSSGLGLISYIYDGTYANRYTPLQYPYYYHESYSPNTVIAGTEIFVANTWQFTITLASNVSSFSRLRYIGPTKGAANFRTQDIKVYNDVNMFQQLNSNSVVAVSNIQYIDYGVPGSPNELEVVDITLNVSKQNTPIQQSGWIACGSGTTSTNCLQYSLNGTTWTSIASQEGVTPLSNIESVIYAPDPWNAWYACGSNRVLKSLDGITWTTCAVTGYTGTSLKTLTANESILIVGGSNTNSNTLLVSTDGQTFTGTGITGSFTSTITSVQYTNNQFWALGTGAANNGTVKYSDTGTAWTSLPMGITTGKDITYGDNVGLYVLAAGTGSAAPYNSPILWNDLPATNVWRKATASSNLTNFTCLTVTYGNGVFLAGGSTTDGLSPIKYSIDGKVWLDTDAIPSDPNSVLPHTAGTTLYFGGSINVNLVITKLVFTNGGFMSLGYSLAQTRFCANQISIMKSANGSNWTFTKRGGFYTDAASWGQIATIPKGAAYGPLTIPVNLSTLYFEVSASLFGAALWINQIEVYRPSISINAPVGSTLSTIYDNNFRTTYYPSEADTLGLTDYSFTFRFASTMSTISQLDFYIPTDTTRSFTGMTVSQTESGNITYNKPIIAQSNFSYDSSKNLNYYTAYMMPALQNISSLYIHLLKKTTSSIQVTEVQALNDLNMPIVQYVPISVSDLNNFTPTQYFYNGVLYTGFVSNMIDGNIAATWYYPVLGNYGANAGRFVFTFSPPAAKINQIQIFNGNLFGYFNDVTAVRIYTDATKAVLLFSNTGSAEIPIFIDVMGYQYIECNIQAATNVSDLYIELDKSYEPSKPILINEIRFFGIGIPGDTSFGYTGGTIETMQRARVSGNLFDGGGGSATVGGAGGIDGTLPTLPVAKAAQAIAQSRYNTVNNISEENWQDGGQWYINYPYTESNDYSYQNYYVALARVQSELSAADSLVAQILFNINNNIIVTGIKGVDGSYLAGGLPSSIGSGGGGGGFYGGGGGGQDINSNGGAGGGGGGYFNTGPLITILEYGVGVPGNSITNIVQNYIPPFSNLQTSLMASNYLVNPSYNYGEGGITGSTSGKHGVVLINFDRPTLVTPTDASIRAIPSFIDSSQVSLFQSPISYATDIRNLQFTTYTDAVEATGYAGYNWVWYRSYLLLTGCSLLPSMTASSTTPSFPSSVYPFMPNLVYTTLREQFTNVRNYFQGSRTLATTITPAMQLAFELFRQFFINTLYTDPSYVQMTEIFCFLDYLRDPDNLLYSHINGKSSQIQRVFGGLPKFGYWANPFLTNTSFIGFDVGKSLQTFPTLSTLVGPGPRQVRAFYGLFLEQSLSSGKYEYKEIMAYKPLATDTSWQTLTQFPESYSVRNLSNYYINKNIVAQPYTAKSAIEGKISLLNYKVYDTPVTTLGTPFDTPIQIINDFQSYGTYVYSFQNSNLANVSSVNLLILPITSTTIHVNQTNITTQSNLPTTGIMGTVVSEYRSSFFQAVQQFGFSNNSFQPSIEFSIGSNNYYNNYSPISRLPVSSIGKSITDFYGNIFASDNRGGFQTYENICTIQIYQAVFSNSPLQYASPKFIVSQYSSGNSNPYYDFFQSRYKNIWHLQGTSNLSTIYGARLGSPYDFSIRTQFVSQIFYPTHKIVLEQVGAGISPIQNTYDLTDYPSYQKTQMFFYRNYSTLVADISGQFAMEKTSNFAYSDTNFSGYFFNSFINNINLLQSKNLDNGNTESFNYLAIRAYSPSETFKCLVRFYLPGRYDFGYISLSDLSNEILTLQTNSNVNPQYLTTLGLFTSSFTGLKTFGGTGLANFSGYNISSPTFGNFLQQYSSIYTAINTNLKLVSTVNSAVTTSVKNLITGDLQNILPSYVANRETVTDPLEFSFPFSTIMQSSNRSIEAYGLGYNLGFAPFDTALNTVQKANSFFKIFDDYIYMKLNVEQNMNRLDISRQENYAVTRDPTAESQLYNCKLILNTFGSFATTLVQNPVTFNPPIGKLDKLTFSWHDATGQVINNDSCVWSASIQVTESVDLATPDSTLPKLG